MNNRKRTALCLLGAALCVFMTFGAALALGRYPITPAALLAGDAMAVRTFTVLRLPRAVMALVGGFGLGAAGFVYQTVFRNPLASPDIIGVSSGASVGAAFAILFVSSGALSTTVCAFAGGLAAVFLSLGLAAAAPGRSKMSLVLAGIAVHALAQTLLMLLKLTADPEKELASIEYWIMGSLAAVTRSRVWFPVPVVLVCCAAIFALHRQALLLSIEEGEARLLGVRVGAMRLLLMMLATMTVAAVVSVTGLISFVGLLAPHSARLLAGHNRRSACLLSGLLGSALLLAAVTALVDALPVFGTGTVLLPWAAACLLLGQAPRAVALAALYAVISAVRSFLEPKVMAAQAGLPPLAALAAMYAGFRAFGVAGMILLPVALLFVKQLHDQGYVGLWK